MSFDTRRILHSAFSFVRSVEANKAAAAITLDHLIGEQITLMKGGEKREILDGKGESLGKRVSKLDALEQLEQDVSKLVDAIKNAGDDEAKLAAVGISNKDFDDEAAT